MKSHNNMPLIDNEGFTSNCFKLGWVWDFVALVVCKLIALLLLRSIEISVLTKSSMNGDVVSLGSCNVMT